mmetsp:Transcript_87646/g.183268  ORF Transcript_87646/g.183268 Transcript_87646/m.183268 type:complete len:241 (+) Transcript_87646:786-1508(+)
MSHRNLDGRRVGDARLNQDLRHRGQRKVESVEDVAPVLPLHLHDVHTEASFVEFGQPSCQFRSRCVDLAKCVPLRQGRMCRHDSVWMPPSACRYKEKGEEGGRTRNDGVFGSELIDLADHGLLRGEVLNYRLLNEVGLPDALCQVVDAPNFCEVVGLLCEPTCDEVVVGECQPLTEGLFTALGTDVGDHVVAFGQKERSPARPNDAGADDGDLLDTGGKWGLHVWSMFYVQHLDVLDVQM